eukprot:CAMPEP_0202871570 /NCGR_PEP_ID=MMETSP1391-20130828/19061_1 /ASSEMBLY_ACC=CAM_ASM_000867 /TAXON_ID=1034604 /ORGANISM="Chlamydomonas leiostraca, Strain SAG 11-49" /LENGTH=409 /DNA_ID=CAMNT_0049552413 /DNA_START=223 /DNA_END=1452 /DNA_ORIENTATION=+
MIFTSSSYGADEPITTSVSRRELRLGTSIKKADPAKPKYAGDSIHTLLTSSGDHYQNYQTRIMYATYKLVQKDPGGERLTGFTRILHRTVPDLLMDEVPTFHAKPQKPQCDGWCDYPVANRPDAIKQWFDAAAANESMIQGAWIFMLECDYVWIKPMQPAGSAYDPSVPGIQFFYDYIIPTHPNAVPSMKKMYPGDPKDIPAAGPAPVLLRFKDWQVLVPEYVRLSAQMEADEEMKKALEWVREMYAWDAAVALHQDKIKILTEHPPNSSTIVQPPFDEGMGRGCLCHYTWGALYHEGLPSKGAKQVYRYEKRDYNDLKYVLKVPPIVMPPEYKDGWILEFDAPLNRKRHDLVVVMLTQMNRGIAILPDLTEHWKQFEPRLNEIVRKRDAGEPIDSYGKVFGTTINFEA